MSENVTGPLAKPAYVVMPKNPTDTRWLTYDDKGPMATGYPMLVEEQSRARLFHAYEAAERSCNVTAYGIAFPDLRPVAIDLVPRPLETF